MRTLLAVAAVRLVRATVTVTAVVAALATVTLALGAATAVSADPVTAVAKVDRDRITIGDPIALSVTVEFPAGYQVSDPGVARSVGALEVLETLPALQSRLAGGGTRLEFRYRVTAFRTGDLGVPALEVTYIAPGGTTAVARTAPIPIVVSSVILAEEDTSDVKPLKPQLVVGTSLAAELQRYAPFLAAAAVALVVACAYVLLRRRRRLADIDGRTAAERALAELERVAALGLPEKGRFAEHYELIGAALRRYVAERYDLPAGERTPRELRGEMERAGVDPQQRATFFEVLSEGEVVRFQGERTYPAHARIALTSALNVLRRAAASDRLALAELEP